MSLVLKPLPKITRQILENISYAAKIWESYSKSLLWYTPLMNYKKKIISSSNAFITKM